MRAYLAEIPAIETEPFPAYAREANPDEQVWRQTEHGQPANVAPEDTAELRVVLVEELQRLNRRPGLLAAFIRRAEISIRSRLSFSWIGLSQENDHAPTVLRL